jgi:hypothetical protein
MTCAECQDLLLELSYGELAASRAREVEEHARTCAECAAALAELSRTRTLVAALNEAEEPPASLDATILEAARTAAVILGDGTQGPVIATDVRVQPLAVEAAQIDPRARVKVPVRDGRRRWALRAALAGSVATAAGLAVVISTRTPPRVAPRTDEAEYRIEVRTADEAHRAAAASAAAQKKPDHAEPLQPASAPAPKNSPAAASKLAKAPTPAPSAPTSDLREAAGRPSVGSVPPNPAPANPPPAAAADGKVARAPGANPVAHEGFQAPARAAANGVAGSVEGSPPPTAKPGARFDAEARAAAEPKAEVSRRELTQSESLDGRARQASGKAATGAAGASGALSPEPQPAADAARLEGRAEATRRQGAFGEAAALYQDASRARAASGDTAAASWDLAHAVECLAAAGRFAEARAGRSELRSLYPDAQGPQAATDRALRTAPAAGDAPVRP